MSDTLVELDNRRRVTLKIGHHDRYLVHEEPDGTLIFRPAVILTEDELAIQANPELLDRMERSMANPATRTRGRRLKRKD